MFSVSEWLQLQPLACQLNNRHFSVKMILNFSKSLCVPATGHETKTDSVIPKLIKAETQQAPNLLTGREILGK